MTSRLAESSAFVAELHVTRQNAENDAMCSTSRYQVHGRLDVPLSVDAFKPDPIPSVLALTLADLVGVGVANFNNDWSAFGRCKFWNSLHKLNAIALNLLCTAP